MSFLQRSEISKIALDFVHRRLVAQFGEPLDSQGQPQRLLVIGMGKLGGRELNFYFDEDSSFSARVPASSIVRRNFLVAAALAGAGMTVEGCSFTCSRR